MPVPLYQVDAFTDVPFGGNPAAVCLLPEDRDAAWMQKVAAEMNLSETAFLRRDAGTFRLRWFTPVVEVALCGHATLASAHILWETGEAKPEEPIHFQTASGRLTAIRRGKEIDLDFPARPAEPASAPPGLEAALGLKALFIGRTAFDYLIEVGNEEILRSLRPDFARLREIPVRGIIVTARSARPEFDFVSRFFAPASGVDEDPVTGSAHCSLGPFWQERLKKNSFAAYQASARGGILRVRVDRDRVLLGGQAVTIFRGQLVS